jgi:hypothetical protein
MIFTITNIFSCSKLEIVFEFWIMLHKMYF